MRVAVLGAGFAGLSVAYFLLDHTMGSASIDLYDPEPIGGGVSGLSSGLLHTYPGKMARPSWMAHQCIQEAHQLITIASQGIDKSVVLSKGILRPALTEQQHAAFMASSKEHKDTEWWDYHRCTKEVPGLSIPEQSGGLYIKEGLTIDVQAYLEGLWQALIKFGVQFHQTSIIKKSELESYDRILIAMGPTTKNFTFLESLPITPIKGQVLDLEWPKGVPSPPMSLISHKYLVMSKDCKTCTVGATFEREFDTLHADQETASAEILPRVTSFFPALAKAKILNCRSGFRAASSTHLPVVGRASENVYFFTGLGSKGLLYHAWVGRHVAQAILSQDPSHFPPELYYKLE